MPENLIPSVQSIYRHLACNPNDELLIRTCNIDDDGQLTSRNGFKWPNTLGAFVAAPDWNPEPVCGNGLYGLASGQQNPGKWYSDGAWLLVASDKNTIVSLGNEKSKAPNFVILAIAYTNGSVLIPQLLTKLGWNQPIYNATVVDQKSDSSVIVGDYGHAIATARAIAGYAGSAKAGNYGIAIAGTEGIAEAGLYGRAISGFCGHSIVGHSGLAISAASGRVSAGRDSCIVSEYFSPITSKRRLHIGYIGETLDIDGEVLKPNQSYSVFLKNGEPYWVNS